MVSRWFNERYKHACEVDPKKNFHSFRHTFMTNLSHNGINDHALKALAGHSEDGVTHDTYVKRQQVNQLHKALVDHLDYGVDLSHIKDHKFAIRE